MTTSLQLCLKSIVSRAPASRATSSRNQRATSSEFAASAEAVAVSATADIITNAVGLLLQTVIVPGAQMSEGRLIEAVALPWFDIVDLLVNDPSIAFQIPWEKWEEIVAGAYKKAAFDEVILTPRSGGCGRDVIATKRGIGTVRVIDQVKRFTPPRLVTANDVRALYGVLERDGAAKGFLTTTSDFAPELKNDILLKPIIPSRIQLINGRELFASLEKLAKGKA